MFWGERGIVNVQQVTNKTPLPARHPRLPGSRSWVLSKGGFKRPQSRFTPPPTVAGSRRRVTPPHRCTERETVAGKGAIGEKEGVLELPYRGRKLLLTQIFRTRPHPPPGSSEKEVAAEIQGRKRRGKWAVIILKLGSGGGVVHLSGT